MYECVANNHESLSGMSRTRKTIQMQISHVLYFYTGGTRSYVLCQNNSLVGYDIEAADAFTIIGPRALPDGRDVCTLVITLPPSGAMIDLLFSSEERLTSASCRSEEHTSELQSPVPISYAVFCLKKHKTRHVPVPRLSTFVDIIKSAG